MGVKQKRPLYKVETSLRGVQEALDMLRGHYFLLENIWKSVSRGPRVMNTRSAKGAATTERIVRTASFGRVSPSSFTRRTAVPDLPGGPSLPAAASGTRSGGTQVTARSRLEPSQGATRDKACSSCREPQDTGFISIHKP